MQRKKRYSGTSQSLISKKLVEPETQLAAFMPRIKREIAPLIGKQLKDIYEIKLMKHQLWVSYKGKDGSKCSQFFSYRLLPIWQKLVIEKIEQCHSPKQWAKINNAIKWEEKHFNYPTEMIDAICSALENRRYEVKETAQTS